MLFQILHQGFKIHHFGNPTSDTLFSGLINWITIPPLDVSSNLPCVLQTSLRSRYARQEIVLSRKARCRFNVFDLAG
jgi:hypothetical protein